MKTWKDGRYGIKSLDLGFGITAEISWSSGGYVARVMGRDIPQPFEDHENAKKAAEAKLEVILTQALKGLTEAKAV